MLTSQTREQQQKQSDLRKPSEWISSNPPAAAGTTTATVHSSDCRSRSAVVGRFRRVVRHGRVVCRGVGDKSEFGGGEETENKLGKFKGRKILSDLCEAEL